MKTARTRLVLTMWRFDGFVLKATLLLIKVVCPKWEIRRAENCTVLGSIWPGPESRGWSGGPVSQCPELTVPSWRKDIMWILPQFLKIPVKKCCDLKKKKNPRKLRERWPNIWKVNSIHQNNCGPEKKSEGKLFWTIVCVWSGVARIKMCKKSLMQHLGELL